MRPEEDLVRACAGGDPRAWKDFVDLTSGWVRHAAQGALRGPRASDVDDAVADVYRQLLERDRALLRSFRSPFNLKAWLTIITRRTCLKALRRGPAVGLSKDIEAPAADPGREEARALGALLEELDAEDRLVLDLFFRQDAPYEHIAAVLGISVESVGKRKFRALERLRQLAKDRGLRPGTG
ncbi:MAG TPA: sigma-70 family RNA polymerase sigma factor [Planctomycetota bacterium]|nr:sigma-70 family RNA polymerase sigma factor [Planctomycetota bacterium]